MGSSFTRTALTAFWACISLLAVSNPSAVHAQTAAPLFDLQHEFYLHHQFQPAPGYPVTDLVVASATGNYSFFAFGNFGVAEHVIRSGAARDSPIIGRAPGTFQPTKQEARFALHKMLVLDGQGILLVFADWLQATSEPHEWAIAGGTGAFRMMTGFAVDSLVEADFSHAVIKWQVYLRHLK